VAFERVTQRGQDVDAVRISPRSASAIWPGQMAPG
jgi:hypothetical protein